MGEGELAAPRVITQVDGQVSIAAYGETATEGKLGMSLVFRTKAEIEAANIAKAANTVKQPALVTLIIGGQEVTGAPGAIAAVMSAMPARAAA